MKNSLLSIAAISFLGLAYSTSAMAELVPFYDTLGDEYICGYKNEKGKIVVPLKTYQDCGGFSEGLAYVGKVVKPLIEVGEGYKHVQGFIDTTGKLVIPMEHEAIDELLGVEYKSFSDGLVVVYRNGKYGYMNKQRELIIPYKYQDASSFSDGLAVVELNDKEGMIDRSGNIIIPIKFDSLSDFSEGLAAYGVNNHWNDESQYGFINKKGETVIKPRWDAAYKFSEGLATVRLGDRDTGKWGVIDTKGNYVVKPKYDQPAIMLFTDAYEFDDNRYKNGLISMYNMTNPNDPNETSVTRYTIDRQGKVVGSKFYGSWDLLIEEYERLNPE